MKEGCAVKKLKYEKPLIAVEQYALSQAIASCPTQIGYNDYVCIATDDDVPPEMQSLAAVGAFGIGRCNDDWASMGLDEYEGVCYHKSVNFMFNS